MSTALAPITGLDGLVAVGSSVEVVATGSIWAEGILYLPATHTLHWSDIPANRIMQHDLSANETSVYNTNAEFTNGRTLDLDGSVVQCSHGHRSIERDRNGVVTSVVESWNDVPFNSPNDIVVAADGSLWFTDPPYGIIFAREGHGGARQYGDHYVFRHDTATGETRPVIMDVEEPNGLAFSPDGKILYVADSSGIPQDSDVKLPGIGNRHIRAYDVFGSRCKNGRTFATVGAGVPDGLRVDAHGNVWTSAADGVHVYSPEGEKLGSIPIPEIVANLCFGGRDGTELFIAASTSIYRITTTTTDANRHA
jgi:gluconolactonase